MSDELNYSGYFAGNSFISFPLNSNLDLNNNISIELWFNFNTSQSNRPLVAKWDGLNNCYLITVPNDSPNRIFGGFRLGGVSYGVYSLETLNDGNWHHAVMTYDNSYIRLYIDGILQGNQSFSGSFNNCPSTALRIGSYSNQAINTYIGYMDEVAIYGYALSEEQIVEHYNIGISS